VADVVVHLDASHDAGPSLVRHTYVGWHDDEVLTGWVERWLPLAALRVGTDVLQAARAKKNARDDTCADGSASYHITLCLPFEFEALPGVEAPSKRKLRELCLSRCKQLCADAAELSLARAAPLGIGRLEQDDGNFALFVVVEWPELQALRARHGLPPNHPHVTVGFRDSDIHGRAKDRATLLPGEEPCPGGVAEDDANGAAEGDAAPARATGESRVERPARCRDACCPPCSVL